MKIISEILLEDYKKNFPQVLEEKFNTLCDVKFQLNHSVFILRLRRYFSKIEGEEIKLDSYIEQKKFGIELLQDQTKKIDDLYDAYSFAKANALNKSTFAQAYKLLAKNIVVKNKQGKQRCQNMFSTNDEGQIEYVAALPHQVNSEMMKAYIDIETLVKQKLNF